jgi:aminoglycoside phosphotransferase (APT) family kinase protein
VLEHEWAERDDRDEEVITDERDGDDAVESSECRRLGVFLDSQGLGAGPVRLDRIGDGHSNLTYLVTRGEDHWVLRRPPEGPLPPSAHNVLREYRILRCCLGRVRVPTPVAATADITILGAPFYLMSHVPGVVLTTDLAPGLDEDTDPPRIAAELIDALVEIHALDWRSTELADLTSGPDAYLERQLRRFSQLRDHNYKRELPVIDKITAWLRRHQPQPRALVLVHGDYRLGNTIFSPSSPACLRAVLDWELATIGDPLADVGYLTATWATPNGARDPLIRLGIVTADARFPTPDELVSRYADASGADVEGLAWYQVFTLWKSAIFLEGSYNRLLAGATDDPFFESLRHGIPELADRAWSLTAG